MGDKTRRMSDPSALLFVIFGAGGMAVFSSLLVRGVEPFHTWFYSFIWWSYLLLVTGLIARFGGEALLLSGPREFLFLALVSAPLWFVFELFNVRLENWQYIGVPHQVWLRWPGYFLGFATVAPAILETAKAVGLFLPISKNPLTFILSPCQGERNTSQVLLKGPDIIPLHPKGGEGSDRVQVPAKRVNEEVVEAEGGNQVRGVVLLGLACLALPLLWPRFFFPLIWGGFFFLLDPLNEKLGWPSLIHEWKGKQWKNTISLLISGGLCGILWELWNFRAGAKWVYSLPCWQSPKIFEMPIAGYLGFPPFALECFAMVSCAKGIYSRMGRAWRPAFWIVLGSLSLAGCWAIDRFTVRSMQWS